MRNAARSPGSFGLIALANQSYGCLDTAPLPTCNDDTLRNDPSTGQPTQIVPVGRRHAPGRDPAGADRRRGQPAGARESVLIAREQRVLKR